MKTIEAILNKFKSIQERNRKLGVDPARMPGGYLYQASHGGFMSRYMHEYRKDRRQELNEYQKAYRAAHPEETKAQDRKDVAAYRKRKRSQSSGNGL